MKSKGCLSFASRQNLRDNMMRGILQTVGRASRRQLMRYSAPGFSLQHSTGLQLASTRGGSNQSVRRWPVQRQSFSTRAFDERPHSEPSLKEKMTVGSANALFQSMLLKEGFDRNLQDMTIKRIDSGRVECSMIVATHHTNSFGTLHGGLSCAIVDIVGTIAVMTLQPSSPGVSVDINCSFLAAGTVGDEIHIVATVLRAGKSLSFTDVAIRRAKDNKPLAIGRHTKSHKNS
jgi:acyl-coenzyme A thioesterase 13